MPTDFEKAR